jgi:hypothetical protein
MNLIVNESAPVSSGFLKDVVEFVAAKGEATVEDLKQTFVGQPKRGQGFETAPVTEARVKRYVRFCLAHGILFLK